MRWTSPFTCVETFITEGVSAQAGSAQLIHKAPAVSKMSSTNDAFRGMNGEERLFKSKAELKAEKAAAKEKKKLEKSKVKATPYCCTTVTGSSPLAWPG